MSDGWAACPNCGQKVHDSADGWRRHLPLCKPVTYRTKIVGGVTVPYLDDENVERLARIEAESDRAHTLSTIKEMAEAMGATVVYDMSPVQAPDSLDAAWAEAEAALPEGWELSVERLGRRSFATAAMQLGKQVPDTIVVGGDTPAAALRALAAKLRETR